MATTLIITILTLITLTASVLFFPDVRVAKFRIPLYPVVALVGAILLISFGKAPIDTVLSSFVADTSINPLKILVLFFSMTFLSVFLDEVGLFRLIAARASAHAGNNLYSLFVIFYFLTAILTVFTSNDVVILTLTPFICFFCKHTKTDPVPFLVGEFAAANTWSMMLVIGNPTNIYLATSAGFGFGEYFRVMALPTVAAGIVEFAIISLIFAKKLKAPVEKQNETFQVKSKSELIIGVLHLIVCLIFLVISDYLSVEMWLVSASCAASLLIFILIKKAIFNSDAKGSLISSVRRLPWQLIPFVLSMFVVTVALKTQGISDRIGQFLGSEYTAFTYGASSYLFSNFINNIPMSMLFSTLPEHLTGIAYKQAVYASIVGSNVGAFLTPIGALAGIMFTDLTARYQVGYGFKQFVKYGAFVSIPTLAAALIILSLILA